jgi:hypothetical protein
MFDSGMLINVQAEIFELRPHQSMLRCVYSKRPRMAFLDFKIYSGVALVDRL